MYLHSQFSRGREDETGGLLERCPGFVPEPTFDDLGEDGEKEGGCLAGSSLSARHQITTAVDDRHSVLLYWSGLKRGLGDDKVERKEIMVAGL